MTEQLSFEVDVKFVTGREGKGRSTALLFCLDKLEMANYLLSSSPLLVSDKTVMFNIRGEMNDIRYNFGNKLPCKMGCNVPLNNEHLLKVMF